MSNLFFGHQELVFKSMNHFPHNGSQYLSYAYQSKYHNSSLSFKHQELVFKSRNKALKKLWSTKKANWNRGMIVAEDDP